MKLKSIVSITPPAVLAAGMLAGLLPSTAGAQAPLAPVQQTTVTVAAPIFSAEIGHVATRPNADLTVNYTIAATSPVASKAVSQKLRFTINEDGLRDVLTDTGTTIQRQGTSTRYMTINTGKYKTLGQLKAMLTGIFERFLAGGLAPNTELGKIGDARYGGEIHFVFASPEVLRCDYVPATAGDSGFVFRHRDAQAFLAILKGAP